MTVSLNYTLEISLYCQSESELLYYRWSVANQFVLATCPLRLTTINFFFQLNACSHTAYLTSSLTRMGLLLTVAPGPCHCSRSQVRVAQDSIPRFTVSDSRLPQTGGPGNRIYIPQEQGGPVPFASPPTTHTATVEVFNPAATWDCFFTQLPTQWSQSQSQSYFNWPPIH
jgi:hypothetical protein